MGVVLAVIIRAGIRAFVAGMRAVNAAIKDLGMGEVCPCLCVFGFMVKVEEVLGKGFQEADFEFKVEEHVGFLLEH